MTNKFITISTDSAAWGDTNSAPEFNTAKEAQRIRNAAESQGIEVLTDETPRAVYASDGSEKDQIDWFTAWCREGCDWTNSQWRNFFAARGEAP